MLSTFCPVARSKLSANFRETANTGGKEVDSDSESPPTRCALSAACCALSENDKGVRGLIPETTNTPFGWPAAHKALRLLMNWALHLEGLWSAVLRRLVVASAIGSSSNMSTHFPFTDRFFVRSSA